MREIATPEGRLVVTDAAVAAVARAAALRCPGVAGTAARGLQEGLRELLLREGTDGGEGGVEVQLDDERLAVAIDIVVTFGAHIPSVAAAVVDAVAHDLEQQVGVRPRRVLVRVQGVRGGPAL